MEAWDGPASILFSDGDVVGAVLDRNGLRPSRYYVTADDKLILSSEVGVLDLPAERIVTKSRLQPGRMLLVDTRQGRIIGDVYKRQLTGRSERTATVRLRGGELDVRWDQEDGHVYMTGPAVTVFEGEWPEKM